MISLPALLQAASILFFVCGACLYYNIRRLLFARGYPISVFVYSGPCWPYYRDLVEKSDAPERRRLRARKTAMIVCFALAGAGLLFASLIAR
jgi:hypothetical protein